MTADDTDDGDFPEDEPIPPRPWSWMAFGSTVVMAARNLAETASALCFDVSRLMMAAANVDEDRRRAYASLHRDLESL